MALLFQGAWAILLTLSGTFSDLLTYTAFASLLFNSLTILGLFVLRVRKPDLERPYKVVRPRSKTAAPGSRDSG